MIYECDKCTAPLPPGALACPKCGDAFEDAVPADAELPKLGFTAKPDEPTVPVPAPVSPWVQQYYVPDEPPEKVAAPQVKQWLLGTSLLAIVTVGFYAIVHGASGPPAPAAPPVAAPRPTAGKPVAKAAVPPYAPQVLTDADIVDSSPSDVSIMRNQIYARHGYIFRRKSLALYFAKQPWYHPSTHSEKTALASMTGIERRNLTFLARASSPTPAQAPSVSASTLTNDEQEYLAKMRVNATRLGACVLTFSNLCSQHDLQSDDWKINMAASLLEMKQFAEEAKGIDAPPRFAGIKTSYDAAMDDYLYIAATMPRALDAQDGPLLETCSAKLDDAHMFLKQANYEVRHIPGVPVSD